MRTGLKALACLMFATAGLAQSKAPSATRPVNKNEAAIRKVYDDWAKAVHARDLDAIMALYAPDVVAYDLVPPLQFHGREAYRKDYAEFLEQSTGPIDAEFRDMAVVAGDDVAFIHCLEHLTIVMKNGQKLDSWVRATSGLRKISGKWLIVHDHISLPTDLDTAKSAMDLKP